MIAHDRLVLLDTNILLYLARGGPAAEWISARYQLAVRTNRILLAPTSVGEVYRLAERRRNRWGPERRERVEKLLRAFAIVPMGDRVLRSYGALGAHLDDTGHPVPQNDVWIAAATAASEAVLLTADRHFDALHNAQLIEREYVDRAALPRPPRS